MSWILLGAVLWALGSLFVLVLVRMSGEQDRAARHEQKRIDPHSDVTITQFGNAGVSGAEQFRQMESTTEMTRDDLTLQSGDPRGWRRARPINQALPATLKWVESLPPEIKPLAVLRDYPRIANALARIWNDAVGVANYLDSLLVDRRGGRRGFPGDVHNELLCLREYFAGRYPTSSARF
ncbi:MAG: hypothetical protein ABI886_14885 [Betaproteobacteria bacterium]